MPAFTVRGVTLGEGRPKIIYPIVETSARLAARRAAEYTWQEPDLLEWRLDWLDELPDAEDLAAMRQAAGSIPILATFRSKSEGGQKELPAAEYRGLYAALCRSGCVDLIDAELRCGSVLLEKIIEDAHKNGVRVVLSSHNFQATPSQAEMAKTLITMCTLGGDVSKLAVMPQSQADVLALLGATWEVHTRLPEQPLITMSMGELGQASRAVCECFGCCATFGTAGRASAPGQIEGTALRAALEGLHTVYKKENTDGMD